MISVYLRTSFACLLPVVGATTLCYEELVYSCSVLICSGKDVDHDLLELGA